MKIAIIILALIALGYKVYRDTYASSQSFDEIKISFENSDIEVKAKKADTQAKREHGLMNVRSMPEDEGMFFVFSVEQRQGFWMKNTYIPLDLIFIGSDYKIRRIHKNAVPQDETIISSVLPIKYTLEVNAGFVDKHNIQEGDKVKIAE